jgi:hypothetical protein
MPSSNDDTTTQIVKLLFPKEEQAELIQALIGIITCPSTPHPSKTEAKDIIKRAVVERNDAIREVVDVDKKISVVSLEKSIALQKLSLSKQKMADVRTLLNDASKEVSDALKRVADSYSRVIGYQMEIDKEEKTLNVDIKKINDAESIFDFELEKRFNAEKKVWAAQEKLDAGQEAFQLAEDKEKLQIASRNL